MRKDGTDTSLRTSRSRWLRGLRSGSAAARLLGMRVRVPREAWPLVCCEFCVLSGRGLCEGSGESYRMSVCH